MDIDNYIGCQLVSGVLWKYAEDYLEKGVAFGSNIEGQEYIARVKRITDKEITFEVGKATIYDN